MSILCRQSHPTPYICKSISNSGLCGCPQRNRLCIFILFRGFRSSSFVFQKGICIKGGKDNHLFNKPEVYLSSFLQIIPRKTIRKNKQKIKIIGGKDREINKLTGPVHCSQLNGWPNHTHDSKMLTNYMNKFERATLIRIVMRRENDQVFGYFTCLVVIMVANVRAPNVRMV